MNELKLQEVKQGVLCSVLLCIDMMLNAGS